MRAGQDGERAEGEWASGQRHPHRPSRRTGGKVEAILVRHGRVVRIVARHDPAEIAGIRLGRRAEDRGEHGQHGRRSAHCGERRVGQHGLEERDPPRIVVGAEPDAGDRERSTGRRIGVEPAEVLCHRQRVGAQGIDAIARHQPPAEDVPLTLGVPADGVRSHTRIRDAQGRR